MHGFVVGSYGWTEGSLGPQPLLSAVKLPFLIGVSALVASPSYWAAASTLGLGRELSQVADALIRALDVFTRVLVSLSPLLLVFYFSTVSYDWAVLGNGPVFFLATCAAGGDLAVGLRPLLHRKPRHGAALLFFGVAFVLVAIQLAWSLRPFVGRPGEPFAFFREQAFTNAYEALLALVRASLE